MTSNIENSNIFKRKDKLRRYSETFKKLMSNIRNSSNNRINNLENSFNKSREKHTKIKEKQSMPNIKNNYRMNIEGKLTEMLNQIENDDEYKSIMNMRMLMKERLKCLMSVNVDEFTLKGNYINRSIFSDKIKQNELSDIILKKYNLDKNKYNSGRKIIDEDDYSDESIDESIIPFVIYLNLFF
jgi:hypothetical protein